MARIAFLGGTGSEGLGLALRFALAGEDVIIGSRQAERAERGAETLRTRLHSAGTAAAVSGRDNAAAVAAAEIVALTLPFQGVEPLLGEMAPALSGKIILDVVNRVVLRDGLFRIIPVPAGSAGELIQALVPRAQVVSGFKNLSAKELLGVNHPLQGDVLLCSDAPAATKYFVSLIRRIPTLRAVDAGALANAQHLESITVLLLNLNRRYRAITSVQVLGIDRRPTEL